MFSGRPLARWLSIPVLLAAYAGMLQAQTPPAAQNPVREERVIAGSTKDSLEVRHLVLRGSNEAIGRALGQLAEERFKVQPAPSRDPLRTRAQRHYIAKHFPILYERMRGVAAACGKNLEDDGCNFASLEFMDLSAGCSVIHLPPSCTATGASIVSRDYDFTTGSILFGPLPPGKLHPTARPYLLELHPDRGYASLAMVAYDLLSGVIDGMNAEGLTVALLADDELASKYKMEPTFDPTAGLGVLQTLRLLLDTCANVDEAKETLLQTKQYYELIPVHYLIADRFGNAFIWEYSQAHNKEFIVENPQQPLVTTNFSLHRYLNKDRPPTVEQARKICPRYCLLTQELAAHPGKLTEDFIKETHKKVDAVQPRAKGSFRPPNRTLWHALYFPEQRRMQVSFYLRDEPLADQPEKVKIVRSEYVEFQLKGDGETKSGR